MRTNVILVLMKFRPRVLHVAEMLFNDYSLPLLISREDIASIRNHFTLDENNLIHVNILLTFLLLSALG
jgi:hypothetical protein